MRRCNLLQQAMTSEPPEISDADLLGRAVAGDEESFALFYRRRHRAVYRFALQMSGRRNVAEEVTQEVFLVVIRDGSRFDPQRGSPMAYLYGIAGIGSSEQARYRAPPLPARRCGPDR